MSTRAADSSAFFGLMRLVGMAFCTLLFPLVALAAPDTTAPRVLHAVVSKGVIGQNLELRVEFQDQSDIFEPKLYFRRVGELEYNAIDLVAGAKGQWTGTIPATFVTRDIEYFLEAFDIMGNGPGRNGSPEKPHTVKIVTRIDPVEQPKEPKQPPPDTGKPDKHTGPIAPSGGNVVITPNPPAVTPVYQRPWFIAVMVVGAVAIASGAVIVGTYAGCGTVFCTTPPPPPPPPGTVTVRITGPDPRTGL